jgi:hypothetical protein
MTAWQQGHLRIYYPTDTDQSMMITMPGTQRWPVLQPTEEPDVRAVMARPWIPDGQVMEGVREQDIAILERQYDFTAAAAAAEDEALEVSRVPMLVMTMTYDLVPVVRPSAPAPAPAFPVDTKPLKPLKPFPRHLVAAILADAAANNAICPITMDPITPDTATVTSCGHVFQTEAIRYWLTTRNECPECREPTCI